MNVAVCVKQIPDTAVPPALDPQRSHPRPGGKADHGRFGQLRRGDGSSAGRKRRRRRGLAGVDGTEQRDERAAYRPRDGSRQGRPGLRPCPRRLGRARHGQGPGRGDPAARCRTSCSPAPSRPTATPARLPVQVAELLGWPSVTFAKHVEISDGVLRVQRQTEAGYDEVTCPLPAVVTVTAGVVEPRYPSFKGIMAAKSKPVDEVTVADLGLEPSDVGAGRRPPAGGLGRGRRGSQGRRDRRRRRRRSRASHQLSRAAQGPVGGLTEVDKIWVLAEQHDGATARHRARAADGGTRLRRHGRGRDLGCWSRGRGACPRRLRRDEGVRHRRHRRFVARSQGGGGHGSPGRRRELPRRRSSSARPTTAGTSPVACRCASTGRCSPTSSASTPPAGRRSPSTQSSAARWCCAPSSPTALRGSSWSGRSPSPPSRSRPPPRPRARRRSSRSRSPRRQATDAAKIVDPARGGAERTQARRSDGRRLRGSWPRLGRELRPHHRARAAAARRSRRVPGHRRRRLGAVRLPGRPDRQDGQADGLHRLRDLRGHPAHGRHEGREEHHRHQQGPRSSHLHDRRPWCCRRRHQGGPEAHRGHQGSRLAPTRPFPARRGVPTSGASETRNRVSRMADGFHPSRSQDMYRQAAEGLRDQRGQSADEGLAGCSSRQLTSRSSSGSSSSATGFSRRSPRAGASSSSSRATCSTGGGTGGSSSCWRSRPSARSPAGAWSTGPASPTARRAWLIATVAAELGLLGLVQVRRLAQRQHRQRAAPSRDGRPDPVAPGHAPGRDLVFHLHGPVVRDRHLPGQSRALALAGRRRLRRLLPAPRRRADRARLGPASPDPPGAPARPAPDRPAEGRLPHLRGPVQEGRALELRLVPDRRPGLRQPAHALLARGSACDLRLRRPDLLRLQRLHRHRHRLRAAARLPLPRELRRPVHGPVAAGLLATVAHDLVDRGCATTCTSPSAATRGRGA